MTSAGTAFPPASPISAAPATVERPRLLVLTDIGGDPDDQQSMVRLMCYSNEFDIEGLIATSRMQHGKDVKPELIRNTVAAYAQVHENLLRHSNRYRAPAQLQGVIKSGQPVPDTIGKGCDTEGSDWIIACADKADPRPLNITIWGGATDLAQALWKVKNTRPAAAFDAFVARLRIHSIGKQDGGIDWVLANAPAIWMVLSSNPAGNKLSVYRGMYLGGDESLTSTDWVNANVKKDHGPLGALYPMTTYTLPNPHRCLKEGDTPSWFYFLSSVLGLGDPAQPEWGGWGGRFKRAIGNLWVDAADSVDGTTDGRATVWRWRPEYQDDFAARMDWCVKPYAQANHPPTAVIRGPLERTVAPGAVVSLDASGSSDPDGNALSYEWVHYREAGTYSGDLTLANASGKTAQFTAPLVSSPQTIHVILKVKDDGLPALVSYKRIVVTVDPCVNDGTGRKA